MEQNIKYFIECKSLQEYRNVKNEFISREWKIFDYDIESRARSIENSSFAKNLKNHFHNNFGYDMDENSVVSYCDVMVLMEQLVNYLLADNKDYDIQLFMELLIPYSNNKRIDFALTFKNTIVLLEFSFCSEKIMQNDYNSIYNYKFHQVQRYKTLLGNFIDPKFKIAPYVVLYHPDYSEELKDSNVESLKTLANFIRKLYNDDRTAHEELLNNI